MSFEEAPDSDFWAFASGQFNSPEVKVLVGQLATRSEWEELELDKVFPHLGGGRLSDLGLALYKDTREAEGDFGIRSKVDRIKFGGNLTDSEFRGFDKATTDDEWDVLKDMNWESDLANRRWEEFKLFYEGLESQLCDDGQPDTNSSILISFAASSVYEDRMNTLESENDLELKANLMKLVGQICALYVRESRKHFAPNGSLAD